MRNMLAHLLLAFISIQAAAQNDYQPGYIITHENDTLYGEIGYWHNLKNHTRCRFRHHNLDTVYSPYDILGYGFPDDVFFTSQVVEGKFAEVLILGQMSLFQSGSDFYIHKTGYPYQLIDKGEYVKQANREGYVNPRWKGIFNYWALDCGINVIDLTNFRPGHRSLVEIVLKYNRCTGADYIEFRTQKPWMQTELNIMTGVDYIYMNMRDYFYRYYIMPNNYDFYGPSAGIQAVFSNPRILNSVAIQTDLNFFHSNSYSLHQADKQGVIGFHESFLSLTNVSGRLGARYTLLRRPAPVYLFAGMVFTANYFSADLYKEYQVDHIISSEYIHLSEPDSFMNVGYSGAISTQRKFGNRTGGISLNYSLIRGRHYNIISGDAYPIDMSFKNLHRISLSISLKIL